MYERFIALPDPHGDHADHKSNQIAYEFMQDFEPEHVISLGDVFDFRPLRKGASKEDQAESMAEDVRMGKEWLRKFKPTVYCLGNHDARLWEAMEYNPNGIIMDLARQGVKDIEYICRENNTEIVPYNFKQCHRIGKANFAHGIQCPMHTAKATAEYYGAGTTFVGHTHSIDYYRSKHIVKAEAYVCGCLCKTDPAYAERRPNTSRWENGFAYGMIHKNTGEVTAWQAKGDGDGVWILPSEMNTYGGET